jgi:hypothetical protein
MEAIGLAELGVAPAVTSRSVDSLERWMQATQQHGDHRLVRLGVEVAPPDLHGVARSTLMAPGRRQSRQATRA